MVEKPQLLKSYGELAVLNIEKLVINDGLHRFQGPNGVRKFPYQNL